LSSLHELFADAWRTQTDIGSVMFRMLAGENDQDADLPTKLIEETAQKMDPSFSLTSTASERLAMSFIETECLVLLAGTGNPKRLLRALRQADRTFSKPTWVGEFFRSIDSLPAVDVVSSPDFFGELKLLAERLAALMG
jgi:hypothetical protein